MAAIRKPLPSIQYNTTYRLREKIASGGMGTVYRAVQEGANGFRKTVAIKTIHKRFLSRPEDVKRFVSEAKLVANLIHENVLQVYQLGMGKSGYYIVMEYVEGLDLGQLLTSHKDLGACISPPISAYILSRVAAALHYAHNARDRTQQALNIVHRDVTPGNIMMNWNGVVKLADFGIAKAMTASTAGKEEGKVVYGSMPFMSPEQARYQPTTPQSDIYSLGLVAYEMFTNQRLHNVTTYEDLLTCLEAPILPPSQLNPAVPRELNDLVMRALSPDPASRWPDAQSLQMQLETYLMQSQIMPSSDLLSYYINDLYREEDED